MPEPEAPGPGSATRPRPLSPSPPRPDPPTHPDPPGAPPRAPGGGTQRGALQVNLQWAIAAGFGLLLLGLVVQTFDTVGELGDRDFDDWASFWASTFQLYGAFAVSGVLVYGGAAGKELPTGTRIIMVLVGAAGLAAVTSWSAAMQWQFYF